MRSRCEGLLLGAPGAALERATSGMAAAGLAALHVVRDQALLPYEARPWVEAVLRQGQGFVDTRRVWGVLSLDKRYGRPEIDGACARALALGSTSYRMVMKMLVVAEALGHAEAAGPAAAPVARQEAPHKYTRSLEDYQNLLPIWQRDPKGGHA